jgi:hypothetical protein
MGFLSAEPSSAELISIAAAQMESKDAVVSLRLKQERWLTWKCTY